MKLPRTEPYRRSRHRATLQAWVAAATAVAAIGLPSAALALRQDETTTALHQNDQTPSQAAHRVAADWLEALRMGDRDAALSSVRLPREAENERAVLEEMSALSDWLRHSGARLSPVAHQHAGHWALSAWRLDAPDSAFDNVGFIEPITLYNPAGDDMTDATVHWEVVPQGVSTDPALAPLYNADHDALIAWYHTLE